jgi:hypothetical protein
MQQFEPHDALFMFGFSRGAYTVRAVASLLHMYGLLPPGNEPLVPYAIRMMNAANKQKGGGAFKLAQDFRATFRGIVCRPHFVGVWDTVNSVGWVEDPLKLPYSANNPDIAIGRHAASIDERRAFFRANLWQPDPPTADGGPKDLKQVWFPGIHCDIGGGYPEAQSGLSKFALEWILREAASAGLLVDRARVDEVMGRTGPNSQRPNRPHEGCSGDESHAGVDERNFQSVLLCDACLQHRILPRSGLSSVRAERANEFLPRGLPWEVFHRKLRRSEAIRRLVERRLDGAGELDRQRRSAREQSTPSSAISRSNGSQGVGRIRQYEDISCLQPQGRLRIASLCV